MAWEETRYFLCSKEEEEKETRKQERIVLENGRDWSAVKRIDEEGRGREKGRGRSMQEGLIDTTKSCFLPLSFYPLSF